MKWLVVTAVIALMVLHQDSWWWDDTTLVFGFLPVGLAYHALISVLASAVWALAVFFAWPKELEEEALAAAEDGGEPSAAEPDARSNAP